MESMEVAAAALERNLGWVRAADQKVPAIFAVNAGMLGILGLRLPHLSLLSNADLFVLVAGGLLLLLSTIFLGCASFPNLAGPTDSVVFFGSAVKFKEAGYIDRLIDGARRDDLVYDLARQAYRNAEIANWKYKFVRWAMLALFGSVPFWLGALIRTRAL